MGFLERCDFRTCIVISENTALHVIIVSSLSLGNPLYLVFRRK
jgi:hypothetical protein